jgi:hypothetical protein
MRRVIAGAIVAIVATAGIYTTGQADDGASAENMEVVATYTGEDDKPYRAGTDMAFWGDRAIVGHLDQGTGPNASPPGGFRILDVSDPTAPQLEGRFDCWGDQSDVSVWEDLVILSVDKPTTPDCSAQSGSWEGIRVISIADPAEPEILASVATDCGSHTNTILPDPENGRLLVYVLSYPLAGRYNPAGALPSCNAATHRKISVVEVPLDAPGDARVIGTPSTGETIGCHDVTILQEAELAGAACLTETQLWSLEDPERPEILASIRNPQINIHHSTVFSNDGNTIVIGDELGGAAASPGCLGTDLFTPGGLFFYDVSDRANPQFRSAYKLPRADVSEFCTAHLFNVVPRRDERNLLVSSWYTGATSVIDFTDPARPQEIAHSIPGAKATPTSQETESATWASYWYNGFVYANNFDEDVNSISPRSRGLDVLRLTGPAAEAVEGAVALPRLNPQLQEPLPPKVSRKAGKERPAKGRGRGPGPRGSAP